MAGMGQIATAPPLDLSAGYRSVRRRSSERPGAAAVRRYRPFGESSATLETCRKADTVWARTRVVAYSMSSGLAVTN